MSAPFPPAIPIACIDVQPGFNARVNLGEDDGTLEALAASIRERGVLQPILVRPGEVAGRYLLVAGHRRLAASRMAGLTDIPARVVSSAETELLDMALENLARRDLCVIERAMVYRRLEEAGWTQTRIASLLGVVRETCAKALRLLKLPEPVRQLNIERKLGESHLLELMPLFDAGYGDRIICELARRTAEKKATASAVRLAVNNLLTSEQTLGRSLVESASPRITQTAPRPMNRANVPGKPPRRTPVPPRAAGSVLARQVGELRTALERCGTASHYADPAEGCAQVRRIVEAALAACPSEVRP